MRGNAVMAMLTLAIISVVAALQVFGKDRLVFWRESESGEPACKHCAGTLHLHVLMTCGCWLYAALANHMGTGRQMLLHSCWKRGPNTLDCMDLLMFLTTCLCFELSSAAPSVVCLFISPRCVLLHAVMHRLVLVIVPMSFPQLCILQGFTHLYFS